LNLNESESSKSDSNKPLKMYKLKNYEFSFPSLPHTVQKEFITKVLDACSKGENALLESPTGTKKSLCILSASLAWL
jgi:regulator of telomere elongation helicase 1